MSGVDIRLGPLKMVLERKDGIFADNNGMRN